MEKLLFIDTETGGTNPQEHSLLSVGMVIWSNKKILDTKEILINDGILSVTKTAIEINKIDLEHHKKQALDPKVAIKQFMEFLYENFAAQSQITIAGHNVIFDVNFLKKFFQEQDLEFNNFFIHRYIDTSSILQYLYYSGRLNQNVSSSTEAFNYFNIAVKGRHTALGDAIATSELFTELINLIE